MSYGVKYSGFPAILWILLSFSMQAQNLKPGIYSNLKPDCALVLDSGSYTFIGLEMKYLGEGVWIDGRKAQKLDLLNCTFEGKDEGTAILSSGDLSVSHSTFTNMKEGILQASPPGSKQKVSIVYNVFRDNGTSIRLEVAKPERSGVIKSGLVSVREDTNRGGESPTSVAITACTLANNLNGIRIADFLEGDISIIGNSIEANPDLMKNPYNRALNKVALGNTEQDGFRARFITGTGLKIGVAAPLATADLLNNHFENCITGIDLNIRTGTNTDISDYAIESNTFTNCSWKGISTSGYGLPVNNCTFNFSDDDSWTASWQSVHVREELFPQSNGVLPTFGIWCNSTGINYGLGEVTNCAFIGQRDGTDLLGSCIGIAADKAVTISQNGFNYLEKAIESISGENHSMAITKNIFTDNGTAIRLAPDPELLGELEIAFSLKCNQFVHTQADEVNRKGLVIENAVKLLAPNNGSPITDAIGGSNGWNTSGDAYPNANVWPTFTDPDRNDLPVNGLGFPIDVNIDNFTGWLNSDYWSSIVNNTSNTITYHRFFNEFVGIGWPAIVGDVDLAQETDQSVETNENTTINVNLTTVPACGTWLDDQGVLFPTRIAVNRDTITTGKNVVIQSLPYLGDAVPNPARNETHIGIFIPAKAEQAVLQMVDAGTGKVLQNIPLPNQGRQEAVLSVEKAPAGIYLYRLWIDGKAEPSKKLVVER